MRRGPVAVRVGRQKNLLDEEGGRRFQRLRRSRGEQSGRINGIGVVGRDLEQKLNAVRQRGFSRLSDPRRNLHQIDGKADGRVRAHAQALLRFGSSGIAPRRLDQEPAASKC